MAARLENLGLAAFPPASTFASANRTDIEHAALRYKELKQIPLSAPVDHRVHSLLERDHDKV